MKHNEFENWLNEIYTTQNGGRLQKRPRSDAMSRCKRVERYEGDLDDHYHQYGMKGLLLRLNYTRGDQEAGINPQHSIPIQGNMYNGTSSLKNAVNLYRQFCEYYY